MPSTHVKAWATFEAGKELKAFEYRLDPPTSEEVEIEVLHCGVCHTDLVFIDNEWGITKYPFVPGHEIIGRVTQLGEVAATKGLSIGQIVGVGWNKESCLHCDQCFDGQAHLCPSAKGTIVGNHGGYASHLKTQWYWTLPLPSSVPAASAGPLMCAGITVFAPLLAYDIRPTDRVGVFGIGGLGHLALQFGKGWGAETVAFSSNASKHADLAKLGAAAVVSSTKPDEWTDWNDKFDLLLITSFNSMPWDKVAALLSPRGRVHVVGLGDAVTMPIASLLLKQRELSGSPVGSRSAMTEMVRFAGRHGINPRTEHFPMSKVNDAIAHLRSGKANYRVVLDADF